MNLDVKASSYIKMVIVATYILVDVKMIITQTMFFTEVQSQIGKLAK